jgi:hypothetical protein
MGQVIHGTSCLMVIFSFGRIVHGAICPSGELSFVASCPWSELFLGELSPGANYPWAKLSIALSSAPMGRIVTNHNTREMEKSATLVLVTHYVTLISRTAINNGSANKA